MAKAKTPAKAKAAPVAEKAGDEIEVGSSVRFLGYPDDTPDEERVLVEGEVYPVVDLPGEEDGEETGYVLQIENPDFNAKKKESETNSKMLEVEVFGEEIELVLDEEAEEAEAEEAEAEEAGEEEAIDMAYLESLDKAGLIALAKEEDIKLTVAQKKTTESLIDAIAEALDLGDEVTYEYIAGLSKEELVALADEEGVKLTTAQKKSEDKLIALLAAHFDVEAVEAEEEPEAEEEKAPVTKGKTTAKAKTAAKEETKPAGKAASKAKTDTKPASKAVAKNKEEAVDEDDLPDLEGEDESVLALVAESKDLVETAQDLEAENSANEFRLGGILFHIRKSQVYKKGKNRAEYAEKGGFAKFVIDHFNLDYRKAMYLIEIYVHFTQSGVENPAEVIGQMGWTKAQKIAKLLTAEDADVAHLVDLASTNTVGDLSTVLKEEYEVGGTSTPGEKKTRVTLKFRYVEEEAKIIEDTLNVAGEHFGTSGEEALFQILADWATENSVETAAKAEEKAPAAKAKTGAAKVATKPAAKATAKVGRGK